MAKASRASITASTLVALLLCGSAQTKASSLEMKPLQQTLNEGDASGAILEHIFLRCMGLYLTMESALGTQYGDLGPKYGEAAKVFLGAALKSGANEQYAIEQSKFIIEAYRERWMAAKAATGNVSDDLIIKSDMGTCKALLES